MTSIASFSVSQISSSSRPRREGQWPLPLCFSIWWEYTMSRWLSFHVAILVRKGYGMWYLPGLRSNWIARYGAGHTLNNTWYVHPPNLPGFVLPEPVLISLLRTFPLTQPQRLWVHRSGVYKRRGNRHNSKKNDEELKHSEKKFPHPFLKYLTRSGYDFHAHTWF